MLKNWQEKREICNPGRLLTNKPWPIYLHVRFHYNNVIKSFKLNLFDLKLRK